MSKMLAWVFGVFFAFTFTGLMLLWWENTELQAEVLRKENTITTLSVQRDALQVAQTGLVAALTVQNTAVTRLGNLQASLDKLFETTNAQVVATTKQISSIRESVSKETTPVTCKDTIQYLKDARKEFK